MVEQWLRHAARTAVEKEIEAAAAIYYRSLRADERAEDEALARALSATTQRVSYDDAPAVRRVRRRP